MSNHSCSVAASQRGECKVSPHYPHLHFVHNQHFHPMKGTPAAVLALTLQIKSCDTGSAPQAMLHLQMSGSRVTHVGETLCCVTPSEQCNPPYPGDFCLCWIIQILQVLVIYVYVYGRRKQCGFQSGTYIAFSGHSDNTFNAYYFSAVYNHDIPTSLLQ